ncbi:MAG: hypothetical protein Q9218_006499 [Villophora microphyllina]
MQHLPLPKDVVPPGPSLVPYVCKEEYDRGPFLTYLNRQGKEDVLAAVSEAQYRQDPKLITLPIDELEALMQIWLFFGLLTEVLGNLFTSSEFVRTTTTADEPSRVVDTSGLLSILDIWVKTVQQSEHVETEKRAQYEHIAACLKLTADVWNAVRIQTHPTFNRSIRQSIVSVAEVLAHATNQAYDITNFIKDNKCPAYWRLFYEDAETSLVLGKNGFCLSEIRRVQQIFQSIQAYHFLTWLDKRELNARHDNCTDRECRASRNNLTQYTTKHTDSKCQCADYFIDVPEVVNILSKGSLPLLQITPGSSLDDINIEVVEASPDINFMALSHVWSDGLGNPQSNSLPKCQLRRLHDLTRQFEAGWRQGLAIWIDTLCCPVAPPEAKNLALSQMKRPYTEASQVIVLDSSLETVESAALHPTEIAMRVYTTGWMRRLWTLQEGALPHHLWFQFKDKAIGINELQFQATVSYNNDLGRKALAGDIMTVHRGLRSFFHSVNPGETPNLASVDYAIGFRSVSVATDEPLLVAGLLNLELGHILDGPESSRMQRLLSILPQIPRNILFRRGSKLTQPGFRWAPSSLLTSKELGDGLLNSSDGLYPTGSLASNGLRVNLPAFSITIPSVPYGMVRNPWGLFNSVDGDNLHARYKDGSWFRIARKYKKPPNEPNLWQLLQQNSSKRTILLETAFQFKTPVEIRDALLVHQASDEDKAGSVVSDMVLDVGIIHGALGTLLEASYQASKALLADPLTAEFTDLAIDDEMTQKINPFYRNLVGLLEQILRDMASSIKEDQVLNAIRSYGTGGDTRLYQALTVMAYMGHFAELGEMMHSHTEWCVD